MIPAIIPARAGSKSVPNKNMRLVKGKPLLQYAIEAAKGAGLTVYVTTDSSEYAKFAENCGAYSMRRPAELAEDVPTEDVLLDTIKRLEEAHDPVHLGYEFFKTVVLMQCTTPLVTFHDVEEALKLYLGGTFKSVISVTQVREHPDWMFRFEDNHRLRTYIKYDPTGPFDPVDLALKGDWGVRQIREPLYRPNGAIYITEVKALREQNSIFASPIGGYVMPWQRSIDVDEEDDLRVLEAFA